MIYGVAHFVSWDCANIWALFQIFNFFIKEGIIWYAAINDNNL